MWWLQCGQTKSPHQFIKQLNFYANTLSYELYPWGFQQTGHKFLLLNIPLKHTFHVQHDPHTSSPQPYYATVNWQLPIVLSSWQWIRHTIWDKIPTSAYRKFCFSAHSFNFAASYQGYMVICTHTSQMCTQVVHHCHCVRGLVRGTQRTYGTFTSTILLSKCDSWPVILPLVHWKRIHLQKSSRVPRTCWHVAYLILSTGRIVSAYMN